MGVMRTAEAVAAGIQPRTLYWMRDEGILDRLSRGVYHLCSFPIPENPDMVAVMTRIPRAVVCLVSALDYHGVGTHIPSSVHIALPRGVKTPKVDRPRIEVFRMGGESMLAGVQDVDMSGTEVAIFSLPKTIADCFKFRNRIGIDVAVEALQEGINGQRCSPSEIMKYAKINRVAAVMRPYVEALI